MPRRAPFVLVSGEDPCPDLLVDTGPDKDAKGVGSWVPEKKHTLLAKWLGGTSKAWAKWPHRIFIDPFCGPGRIQVKGEIGTRDGGTVVAYRESVRVAAPFTQMLIGDKNEEKLAANTARLRALGAHVKPFPGAARDTIKQMVKDVPKGTLAFAYIDPYNLSYLSFDIIETLATQRVDFAVHFSVMDVTRNVEVEFDDETRRGFEQAAPGWREKVSPNVPTPQFRQALFEYWCGLVRGLGFKFSEEMPLVRGDGNAPLYRLVFFSRSEFATRVWADVAKSTESSLRLPF